MKVNRDSWHYKLRAKMLTRQGFSNIIEYDTSPTTYIFDIFLAIITLTPLRSGKQNLVEFYDEKD